MASSTPSISNPVVLVSIDGWGHSTKAKGNAIANAQTPHMDALSASPLSVLIDACGLSVGLPAGVMGNSEVGHLTMGVGRVEFQDLVRINMSLEDGSFYSNRVLQSALEGAKQNGGRFHLLGLVSDGGVHSHIEHLEAFLTAAKQAGVPNTFVHFFADGRDTPPSSGTKYIQRLLDFTHKLQYGQVTAQLLHSTATHTHSCQAATVAPPSVHSLTHSLTLLLLHCRVSVSVVSLPLSSVATTRWTAISVGTASEWRTSCSLQARETACRPEK